MDIKVTLTLSDRLFDLLETKLPNLNRRFQKVLNKEIGKQAREESSISISISPTPTESARSPEAPETPEAPANTDAPEVEKPEPQPETPTALEPVKETPAQALPHAEEEITPEKARKAFAETRRRLLGEDYESQKGTPKYKAVTNQAKQIILAVSGGRASTIPSLTSEERRRFMEACDELNMDADGNITTTLPF